MSYDVFYFGVIICSSGAAHYYLQHYRTASASSDHHPSGRGRMINDDDESGLHEGSRFGRDNSVSPTLASSAAWGKTTKKSPNPAKTAAATLLAVTKDCCES